MGLFGGGSPGGVDGGLFSDDMPFGATATGDDGSTFVGGSDGNVFQTGLGTGGGSDAAGYAQAVGGGTKALVGLMFGNRQLKMQKEITGIQHQQTREQFKNAMLDSSQNEVDLMRQNKQGQNDAAAQFGAMGTADSSGAQFAKQTMQYNSDVKLDALRRQRALEQSGMGAQEKVWDLQKKQARANQQEAAVAAGIDTAISLASAI